LTNPAGNVGLRQLKTSGAIGFDWFTAGVGCVSWLISRPRKKLIKTLIANKNFAMVA
jgi:hypothetical protein